MRYAIYFAPSPTGPLTRAAAAWLGRDAFTGEALPHPGTDTPSRETIAAITSSPRRYGFHATLKAPFRLAQGQSEAGLIEAFEAFAAETGGFTVPEMVVGNISGFFAIVPREPSAALGVLADKAVIAFEPFRAPLTQAEIARRNPGQLSPREIANLDAWGYPYVFESFQFHMTLTNRIPAADRSAIDAQLQRLIMPVLPKPFPIEWLGLFVEPEPGAPFTVLRHARLAHTKDRRTA